MKRKRRKDKSWASGIKGKFGKSSAKKVEEEVSSRIKMRAQIRRAQIVVEAKELAKLDRRPPDCLPLRRGNR